MFLARRLSLVALILGFSTGALSQCSGSMNIVTPAEGATVNSHFQIDAVASSSCPITTVHVYIDNRLQFAQYGQAVLSGKFNAGIGVHQVVVQAWASDGKVFNKTIRMAVDRQVPSTCQPAFDPNVDVCAPVNLAASKGAVLLHAAARSSVSPVVLLRAFANGTLKAAGYNENALEMDAAFTLPRGLQNINVVARSSNGAEFQNQTNVQVVSPAATCESPFISNVFPIPGVASEFQPFLAAADAAACPIVSFQVYVDNRLFYSQSNQNLFDGWLTIPPGEHNVVLQAWNSHGAVGKKTIKINISGLHEATCLPATDPGVAICPNEVLGNGYTMIIAGTPAVPASPYTALRIYVDNISRATFYDFAAQGGITLLRMAPGTHKVTAVAWTAQGAVVTDTQVFIVP
jgi:hypothetical protein